MSYVRVFAIDKEGNVEPYDKAHNNHGGAPLIWKFLGQQYGCPPTGIFEAPEKIWEMFGKGTLTRADEILLGATFDRVWVPRALVPELVESIKAFHIRYVAPNNLVETLQEIGGILEAILREDPTARGVAFDMCSAAPSFWFVREDVQEEDGDYEVTRAVNLDRDKGPGKRDFWELVPSV